MTDGQEAVIVSCRKLRSDRLQHGDDAGVPQRRQQPKFVGELVPEALVMGVERGGIERDPLQGDHTVKQAIISAQDDPHAAAPDLA